MRLYQSTIFSRTRRTSQQRAPATTLENMFFRFAQFLKRSSGSAASLWLAGAFGVDDFLNCLLRAEASATEHESTSKSQPDKCYFFFCHPTPLRVKKAAAFRVQIFMEGFVENTSRKEAFSGPTHLAVANRVPIPRFFQDYGWGEVAGDCGSGFAVEDVLLSSPSVWARQRLEGLLDPFFGSGLGIGLSIADGKCGFVFDEGFVSAHREYRGCGRGICDQAQEADRSRDGWFRRSSFGFLHAALHDAG